MPRVSIRRLFVYFLGAASFVLLALNFHQGQYIDDIRTERGLAYYR